MDRIDLIYNHPKYKDKYSRLLKAEEKREFCNHTMEHFLDVARLMYIRALEQGMVVVGTDETGLKEIIYAIGLMHDIGRIDQIENGISHDMASAAFCEELLPECQFTGAEIECIKDAIINHRSSTKVGEAKAPSQLGQLLFWADKKSRRCYECMMIGQCNWPDNQKNKKIEL